MNVRLIAGRFGGRIIEGSDTDRTHPMSERIRNALFNKISDEIKDASILDAFAGSGAIGLEAVSRGAKNAVLIDSDKVAQKIIERNIYLLGVQKDVHLIRSTVSSWAKLTDERFDIIFADPPFNDMQLSTVSLLFGLLKPNGLMVLSYPGKGEVPAETGVVVVDNRSYGNAALAFYRQKDA
ncbi:MAG: 16S rRNA (guanine(966)-N(2))-methyltransferase RsmD [Candidatus Saccharimonadales bacterium]